MTKNRAEEVLYESEAALRLVDHQLDGIRDVVSLVEAVSPAESTQVGGLAELPAILERANRQILSVLAKLRETRAAIESSALERIQATHDKIREVTSATEDAAINIMDACDRAQTIVDELDAIDIQPEPDRDRGKELRVTLRDELFVMMNALQFQDITSQQLSHASAVIVDMERRLIEISKMFDPKGAVDTFETQMKAQTPDENTYDPNATTKNAEGRQALADDIFTNIRSNAA